MANIPIWPGSSSFSSNIAPTPFGFYDDDLDFSEDADKLATAWDEVRAIRDTYLKRVDIHQGVLRYETLTATQQAELAVYRQALLDITEEGSPEEAISNMPVKPEWV